MRRHASVESAAGLTPFGHLGWAFRERSELLARAAEYIADGVSHNQRVVYVGEGTRDMLRAELAAMPQVADHLPGGSIDAIAAADYYVYHPGSDVLDAARALEMYIATTRDAISNGYNGFRAVVDVTSVARSPAQRETLAKLEFLVDQQMAVLPFSALCAYDVTQLQSAADELICLHPFVSSGTVGFQIYADPEASVDFAIAGEIDASNADLFATTLGRLWPLTTSDTLHLDVRALRFIGQRQLVTLDQMALRHASTVVLHTDEGLIRRLLEILELTAVRAASSEPLIHTSVWTCVR